MKILVVHAKQSTCEEVKLLLSKFNPEIYFANDGIDGLYRIRERCFDLIICGLELPLISGIELVRTARNSHMGREVPVLFLSEGEHSLAQLEIFEKLNAKSVTTNELETVEF